MVLPSRLTIRGAIAALASLHVCYGQAWAQEVVPHERPPVGPWIPTPRRVANVAGSCQSYVVRDSYRSIQVNVDARGCNFLGDAANEPSIAVSATDPRKIVIGWRQFDSVLSDFRQVGWAFSHDAGHTWVFRGSLDPGVFGSDPVLAAGPTGVTYYLSINFDEMRLFRSFDGGTTWGVPIQVSPGFLDKPWMAVDTTKGIGLGNIYIVCNCSDVLLRSTDGGSSWTSFGRPGGGSLATIHVGPTGTLYVKAGSWFSKSEDAKDPTRQPTWVILDPESGGSTQQTLFFNWGGGSCSVNSPNPDGLIGQPWLAAGNSNSVTQSNVYVLTHSAFDATGSDPMDVLFVRSADGGIRWERPVVINDDPPRCKAWQWFALMSVAPNGRIDVVWNDTRNTGAVNLSELYYAYSTDAGSTWSTNVTLSQVFDSHVGWPQQAKLGDYYHMVSDNLGVNVAYAATFNGEQDVYFLRIGPWDCNGNEIDDALDIGEARSRDCNANDVPDECEYRADANGDGLTTLSDFATFQKALTGPGVTIPNDCTRLLDPDHDGDVDLRDFYLFTHVFVTP